jgi:hypothetical protein
MQLPESGVLSCDDCVDEVGTRKGADFRMNAQSVSHVLSRGPNLIGKLWRKESARPFPLSILREIRSQTHAGQVFVLLR